MPVKWTRRFDCFVFMYRSLYGVRYLKEYSVNIRVHCAAIESAVDRSNLDLLYSSNHYGDRIKGIYLYAKGEAIERKPLPFFDLGPQPQHHDLVAVLYN